MRVANVMAGAEHGGAELFFERLSTALGEAGETVLPVIRRDPARAARLRASGLMPVELGFGGALDLLTRPRLDRALRRFAPRVTIAWMNRAARLAPRGGWILVGRLGGYYDLAYYRRCDHLVGNTRGLADWIVAQGVAASRVSYLPNFCPDLRGAAPQRLGVPQASPMLLALGRLHRNKGFDVLLRAMPALPGVHVVIAGEGPERAALQALAAELGVASRLHLPGWQPATDGLLAAADALVCPSRHEPLGNVVLEAFSAGCPVIAARASGPAELITPGEDGVLVPPEDASALASAIASVLADAGLRARLAAAGRARFEASHAKAPVLARWRSFLSGLERPSRGAG